MPEGQYEIQRFLKLRKLTRAIADLLRGQLTDYLSTLTPLLRPKSILGEYVQGSKESVRGSEKAFLQLQRLYSSVASAKPYDLVNELTSPLQIESTAIELSPLGYSHVVTSDGQSKAITVTSPFKWVLTYSGFSPAKLQELLANRNRTNEDTHRFVLHYTVLHILLASHPRLSSLMDALRFPISSTRSPEFGELPLTCISSCLSTIRPPDDVIIESTEISGQHAFEEIVNLDDLRTLADPLKLQLIELARGQGEELASSAI